MIDRLVAFLSSDHEKAACVVVGHSCDFAIGHLLPRVWEALDATGTKPQQLRRDMLIWKGTKIYFQSSHFNLEKFIYARRDRLEIFRDHAVYDLDVRKFNPKWM